LTLSQRSQRPSVETLDRYRSAGINRIELGYCPNTAIALGEIIESADFDAVAHNYFRPVEDEFILNLASQDKQLRERSVEYVRNGIEFCSQHNIDSYTFHAGFRVDPDNSFEFSANSVPRAETCLDTFVESLETVLPYAERHGVNVAIENNVVEDEHVINGHPVVLLAGPEEFEALLERIDVEVLLDTGHLNVAAETLGFNRESFLDVVEPAVAGLHLHTNDGTADSHEPVRPTDWAFEVADRFDVTTTIEARFPDVTAVLEHQRMLGK